MTTYALYDNFVGAPSIGSGGPNFVLGTPFTVEDAITLTTCGFYEPDTAGSITPTQFAIYDLDTQAAVVAAFSCTATGNLNGWNWTALPTPYEATAGQHLVVCALYPYQASWGRLGGASRPAPPVGVSFPTATRYYLASATMAFPTSNDATYCELIACQYTTTYVPPAGTPATLADVEAVHRSWESTNANDHQADGLPWLSKEQIDLIKTVVDSISTALANVPKDGDSNWTIVGKLWQIAGALSEVEIAAWNAFAQRAPSQLTGASGGGGSAFYGPSGTQVSDAAEQTLAIVQALATPPPPASWVSQGTTTFDTSITWEQEADIYTITFSDLGAGSINTTAGLADVSYRLAWWSPWNGSAARDRRFIDFPTFQAFDGGQRMPGIVLLSPQGASGTIEAFTYQ